MPPWLLGLLCVMATLLVVGALLLIWLCCCNTIQRGKICCNTIQKSKIDVQHPTG